MVRVITIMDDVYSELHRIKTSKGMSFSEVLRFLLKEKRGEGGSVIALAGSVNEKDINRGAIERIKREVEWAR
ncbi:antitoxin VapB family protein [Candidatus Micrarchaeota archaeon]|nr:antitoxin VapB family protein [Candidatus Micrarchaeota archaeon]MBU1165459.1 antitoxin VapB family protein [Candidatus Micrarchaeota archaeon]MBU1887440.1 antitoxin VapB family protein [Candidatus Micrarchaeota archaeon]